uniref:Integrin beta subunit VWA domain-containing protein n=1 Tax=Acrobeloides nanus TaxID=290746 RepID=A0A914DAZ1_9BILA
MKRRYRIVLFSIVYIFIFVLAVEDRDRCRSVEGSKSCGQCIKIPGCAWCLDSRSNSSQRCDLKTAFTPETCAPHYVYSPATEIKIAPQHNLPLDSKQADGVTITQLEPQQIVIKMKPGDILEVPFKYQHRIPVSGYEVRDFSIQTSEFRSLGLGIEFFIECDGTRIGGRVCPGVKVDQIINFYAKVTLNECKAGGDIAVSIGVYGYNTVSGLFITPVCGCECEKLRNHERSSASCAHAGTQICGACLCDEGRGGNNCECSLAQFSASSADELENRCRKMSTYAVGKANATVANANVMLNIFVLAKANVSVVVAYVKKVSPETIALVQPIKNHAKKTESYVLGMGYVNVVNVLVMLATPDPLAALNKKLNLQKSMKTIWREETRVKLMAKFCLPFPI